VTADLADVLRQPFRLDALLAREGEASVAARANDEGVSELLAWARPDVPWLNARRRAAALAESAREALEVAVFDRLSRMGITAAVMKGASIARTHYPAPWCRPRLDLDLLIRGEDRLRAFGALTDLGYAAAGRLTGDIVNHQELFERVMTPGLKHMIDVHWEATNRVAFVQRLPGRELLHRARPAPWAGGVVLELDPIDSLILASIHRAAHHPTDPHLIWWYDIHLLAQALDGAGVAAFCARAEGAGVASLCAHELGESRRLFGGSGGALAGAVIERLSAAGREEPTRHYLASGRTTLGDAIGDLSALGTWRDRARLVREHLFPPRAFMAATYGTRRAAALPWLYVWRIAAGGVRWIWDAVK
jgi:hypothetical protein